MSRPILLVVALLPLAACSSDDDNMVTGPSRGSMESGGAPRVKVEALVSDRSGSCPTLRFRLGGIAIATTATTRFELPCAQIVNGAGVEVDGPAIRDGVLSAREVEGDEEAATDPDFEAEGSIQTLSSANDCSSVGRTVTVLGLRFVVGPFTRFKDIARECAGLATGVAVRARGPLVNAPSPPAQPLRATELERR